MVFDLKPTIFGITPFGVTFKLKAVCFTKSDARDRQRVMMSSAQCRNFRGAGFVRNPGKDAEAALIDR
jgi:hypothetical protein